jgi:hypothetical protein
MNFDTSKIKIPSLNPIVPPSVDTRSRADKKEDFEKKLSEINKEQLDELVKMLEKDRYIFFQRDVDNRIPDLIENSLTKFSKYINEFEQYKLEEERKLSLKTSELKLEASHDWREKFRLFFFRALASLLFIITIFTIGYLEKNYEWAQLPLSKYIKSVPTAPK